MGYMITKEGEAGEGYRERVVRRFEYLDGLIRQPGKVFYISGLVPSIFTLDLSRILGDTEEFQRNYQRACGLFVGYLRDIYALLVVDDNIVGRAKELGLVSAETEERLLGEAVEIDKAIPFREILDGVDTASGKETAFFDVLSGMADPKQFQERVVRLSRELEGLSTLVLLKGDKMVA